MVLGSEGGVLRVEKYLTPDDVAARLQIKRHRVLSIIRKDGLVAVRIGSQWRISPQDLDAWIASKTTGKTESLPTRTPLVSSSRVAKIFGRSHRADGIRRRRSSRSDAATSTNLHVPLDETALSDPPHV
jgi:excisionase family DNA binding protein